jgi:hypothetical protein
VLRLHSFQDQREFYAAKSPDPIGSANVDANLRKPVLQRQITQLLAVYQGAIAVKDHAPD